MSPEPAAVLRLEQRELPNSLNIGFKTWCLERPTKESVSTGRQPLQSSPGPRQPSSKTSPRYPRPFLPRLALGTDRRQPLPHPLPDRYLSLDAGFFSCPTISLQIGRPGFRLGV